MLFTIVMLTTHLTGIYELALRNPTVHSLEHAAYFWSGVIFLLPLVAADPVPHPPGAIVRFSWLMAAMTVMSIPAALFIFDEHVRYPFYLAPARALHRSALADQHAAGMIMLFAGGVAMALLAIFVSMEAMIREERRQLRRDAYLYSDGAAPGRPGGGRRRGAGGRVRRGILTFAAIVCGGLSLFDFGAHAEDQGSTARAVTSSPAPPSKLVASGT